MPELRDYQKYAVDFMQERQRSALFLDMGLGKTASVLASLRPEDLPALVTAPPRVASDTWPGEAEKWRPDLTLKVAEGTPKQRRAVLDDRSADIVALSRNSLKDLTEADAKHFKTIVLDEMSGFKSRGVWWKQMKTFLRTEHRVIGLTGTPAPNGLLDLWPQIYLLDFGKRLGKNITAYRNRYFVPGRQLPTGVTTEWNIRPGAEARIHALIEDICLSMSTDGRVELPPVTENIVKVSIPPAAMKAYREMRDTMVADLSDVGGDLHTAATAAVVTNKLAQITAGFIYHDADGTGEPRGTYDVLHSAKIDAVKDIVREAQGSPVLVFYRFQAELTTLKKAFPNATVASGGGFVQRWNRGEIPVLLAHPASAGHGLNLQHGGHIAVWLTSDWSLELDQQANKRLARSGQKHPVVIHRIVVPGTVDEAILSRLKDKTTVQQALIDYLERYK